MTTHTITITITSNMSVEEIECWIQDAIETDLRSHLLEGESVQVSEVK